MKIPLEICFLSAACWRYRSHASLLVAQAAALGRFRAETILNKWRKDFQ
jgi:hypothetical protein